MTIKGEKLFWKVSDSMIGLKLSKASQPRTRPLSRKAARSPNRCTRQSKAKIEQVEIDRTDLQGAFIASDVIDMSTGEVLVEANHELTNIEKLRRAASRRSRYSFRTATTPATSFP